MVDIRTNPLNTAVEGLKRQEENVTRAVQKLNEAQVVNNNTVAAQTMEDTGDVVAVSDEAVVTDAVRNAVIPPRGGDLAGPLVDLIQAKAAYQASAQALKITADIESDTAKLLRRDV